MYYTPCSDRLAILNIITKKCTQIAFQSWMDVATTYSRSNTFATCCATSIKYFTTQLTHRDTQRHTTGTILYKLLNIKIKANLNVMAGIQTLEHTRNLPCFEDNKYLVWEIITNHHWNHTCSHQCIQNTKQTTHNRIIQHKKFSFKVFNTSDLIKWKW